MFEYGTISVIDRALRIDLEREDEIESYIKFMEQNPHVGNGDEDDIVYEYDEEGNIINKEKKVTFDL